MYYGIPRFLKKQIVENCRRISSGVVATYVKIGKFPFVPATVLIDTREPINEEDKHVVIQVIKVRTSRCNLGGYRLWLLCPIVKNGVECGRRVRFLYLPPGFDRFGCRECLDLTYEARQRHKTDYELFDQFFLGYFVDKKDYEKQLDDLRVKYWRGQPTHRYKALSKKLDKSVVSMLSAQNTLKAKGLMD